MDKIINFTAANSLPLKIINYIDLIKYRLLPIHVQLIPTNVCNLNCSFCSCKGRDKKQVLEFSEIVKLVDSLVYLKCKAVTITGGGEPLTHPNIKAILELFYRHGIKVGLVTNGILLDSIPGKYITWCRISCSDERYFIRKRYETAVIKYPDIDWAFSYVLSNKPDIRNIAKFVKFSNEHKFTHIRIVSDLLNLDEATDMQFIKDGLKEFGIDDSLVIYQGRKNYTPGDRDCLISLLKPVIGADGYIYPCCGAQYALKEPALDMPESMRIGHISDIIKIYSKQSYFNGSVCAKCYYQNYNVLLSGIKGNFEHKEFV